MPDRQVPFIIGSSGLFISLIIAVLWAALSSLLTLTGLVMSASAVPFNPDTCFSLCPGHNSERRGGLLPEYWRR